MSALRTLRGRILTPAGQYPNLRLFLQKTVDDTLAELAGCARHKNSGCHGALTFRRCVVQK